jgi:pimeloyl-ACP methyl ester carboxylesterase
VSVLVHQGARVAYDVSEPEAGAADAPAVVFLHNIFCDRRIYAGAVAALRGRYRTIALDFRGHGESPAGARPYDVADLAGDVVAVLDHERVASATIVGLSIGATVALELALAHPERVERLVLMGADADGDRGMSWLRNRAFCRLVMLLGVRWFILGAVTSTLFGAWFRQHAPVAFGVFRARIAGLPRRAAQYAMRAWMTRRPLLDEVSKLQIPVRIVVGDEDVSCPLPCGQRLEAALPGAELVRIPHAGHTMPAERPEATTAVIAAFLPEAKRAITA